LLGPGHVMRRMDKRQGLWVALTAIAAALAIVSSASAAPAATLTPTRDCWRDVVNDWIDNNRVDRTYAIPCYTQAIQKLNSYPDVQNYSSAADDIQRALLAAIRQDRGGGPGAGSVDDGSSPSGGSSDNDSGTPSANGSGDESFFHRIANAVGPSNAQSVPLPLLVLGGLALLLLLAAGGTWLARRLQARRVTPAPSPKP
jgi:hypothetical protein